MASDSGRLAAHVPKSLEPGPDSLRESLAVLEPAHPPEKQENHGNHCPAKA